ncbi:MAG: RNA polymerase sigma factor [Prevotella sp.]|jgi:RNA polymerase sigma-70 factor (ECF subfamily)|nr:RNA polymerase sigma factor [Prevotella sp.]
MKKVREDFLKMLSDYQGIVHKVCLIYFKTEADRKDNFQEVVYQLWRSFTRLEDKTKVASWIYNIAINTSISKIRKDSRIVYHDSVIEFSQGIDSSYQADKEEELKFLLEAICQLNDIDKSIMLLYLEEYNYNEIADILGITKTNVGTRINRAKKVIKQYLNKLYNGN